MVCRSHRCLIWSDVIHHTNWPLEIVWIMELHFKDSASSKHKLYYDVNIVSNSIGCGWINIWRCNDDDEKIEIKVRMLSFSLILSVRFIKHRSVFQSNFTTFMFRLKENEIEITWSAFLFQRLEQSRPYNSGRWKFNRKWITICFEMFYLNLILI